MLNEHNSRKKLNWILFVMCERCTIIHHQFFTVGYFVYFIWNRILAFETNDRTKIWHNEAFYSMGFCFFTSFLLGFNAWWHVTYAYTHTYTPSATRNALFVLIFLSASSTKKKEEKKKKEYFIKETKFI